MLGASRHGSATRFSEVRASFERFSPRPGWRAFIYEFLLFGFKQAWACLFGGLLLGLLILTHLFYPEDIGLARYDFITISAIGIQLGMLALHLETLREAKVIFAFHFVGTVMELFKTAHGSWAYPEPSLLRIGDVPLFSGFMYAAVGSYIARIWRIFDFRFTRYPPTWAASLLGGAIYVNFFAHHWLPDIRGVLFVVTFLLFWRTKIHYRPWHRERWMPLLFGWFLVALFIWLAENIATFSRAWIYPGQAHGWHMVSFGKLGAWYLLMIISFLLVAMIHEKRQPEVNTLESN